MAMQELILLVLIVYPKLTTSDSITNCQDIEDNERTEGTVFFSSMARISSVSENCWLETKPRRLPAKYADGRRSTQMLLSGCSSKYKEKPKKEFESFEENLLYNPEGPMFEILTQNSIDKYMEYSLPEALRPIKHMDAVALFTSKDLMTCLQTHRVLAPVSENMQEVAGHQDQNQGQIKYECDWIVHVEGGGNWKPGAIVQFQHKKTKAYLAVSGEFFPEKWGKGMKEVAGLAEEDLDLYLESTYWTVDLVRIKQDIDLLNSNEFYELYGPGTTQTRKEDRKANLAFSIEDIGQLHDLEVKLTESILKIISEKQLNQLLGDYSIEIILKTDPLHPIDIYNLLKRTARAWKSSRNKTDNEAVKREIDSVISHFPSWDSCRHAAATGLLNLQSYYDISPKDLIQGIVKFGDNIFKAASTLRAEDCRLVGKMAQELKLLDSVIVWYKTFPELKKFYRSAVEEHNNLILSVDPEEIIRRKISTFSNTIDISTEEGNLFEEKLKKLKEQCYTNFTHLYMGNANMMNCYAYFVVKEDINRHCKGTAVRNPELAKTDNCENLDYKDPYLKLGPFKLEILNAEPYMGLIHGFVHSKEMTDLKNQTRFDMKSTPYLVNGEMQETSYHRTSKIKYISERNNKWAQHISKRLELATAFNLYNPNYRYTSENYQVMNYGIGGFISPHMDSTNDHWDTMIGGGRFMTTMLYLSDVEAGGRTVFPHVNVGVSPVAGNLLFWNIRENAGTMDIRMIHLGCPVLYGNKWIANKWVRWTEQMNRFPCNSEKSLNHGPHHRDISYNNSLQKQNILTVLN